MSGMEAYSQILGLKPNLMGAKLGAENIDFGSFQLNEIKGKIARLYELPKSFSKEGLDRESDLAGKAVGTAFLMQQFLKQRQRRVSAMTQAHGAASGYAQFVMRNDLTLQQNDVRLMESLHQFGIGSMVNQSYSNGYQEAFNSAHSMVDL